MIIDIRTYKDFVMRFGKLHDQGVLEELLYEPKKDVARMTFQVIDPDDIMRWKKLEISFFDVEYFVYYRGKHATMGTTMIEGIYASVFNVKGKGDLVFVDFNMKKELRYPVDEIQSLDVNDFHKSDGMCAAKSVTWEEYHIS